LHPFGLPTRHAYENQSVGAKWLVYIVLRLETKLLPLGVRAGYPSQPAHVQTECVIGVWRLLSITNLSRRLRSGVGYHLMWPCRSRILRLLFPVIICLLLGGILTTEIPELLSLTDVTSNDFTLQPTISADSVRVLGVAMPVSTPIALNVLEYKDRQFSTVTEAGPSPEHLGLFILHSILRR